MSDKLGTHRSKRVAFFAVALLAAAATASAEHLTAPDRQQIIAGVVDHPLPGQKLRLDVIRVKAR